MPQRVFIAIIINKLSFEAPYPQYCATIILWYRFLFPAILTGSAHCFLWFIVGARNSHAVIVHVEAGIHNVNRNTSGVRFSEFGTYHVTSDGPDTGTSLETW